MRIVHVALQEGFEHDTVVVRIAGREVYRGTDVTSQLPVGFADAVEVESASEALTVTVEVPNRNLSQSYGVEGDVPVYLGVYLEEGKLRHRRSGEPFAYL